MPLTTSRTIRKRNFNSSSSHSGATVTTSNVRCRGFFWETIVRKTDSRLSKGEDVVVCLPGARIEHVTEMVEQVMGTGKGGSIVVHAGTNNADREGTSCTPALSVLRV